MRNNKKILYKKIFLQVKYSDSIYTETEIKLNTINSKSEFDAKIDRMKVQENIADIALPEIARKISH